MGKRSRSSESPRGCCWDCSRSSRLMCRSREGRSCHSFRWPLGCCRPYWVRSSRQRSSTPKGTLPLSGGVALAVGPGQHYQMPERQPTKGEPAIASRIALDCEPQHGQTTETRPFHAAGALNRLSSRVQACPNRSCCLFWLRQLCWLLP